MTITPAPKVPRIYCQPDWERIAAQYRIGTMSLREIASGHGLTEGAIRKRAKKDAWTRDLSAKVRMKADALVRKAVVRSEVREPTPTETSEVELEANVLARVRLSHRKDIAAARDLLRGLLGELEQLSPDLPPSTDIERALAGGVAAGTLSEKAGAKMIGAVRQALSLGTRATIAKSLLDALKTSVALEREAFGLDVPGNEPKEDALASLLRNLKARTLSVVEVDPRYSGNSPSRPVVTLEPPLSIEQSETASRDALATVGEGAPPAAEQPAVSVPASAHAAAAFPSMATRIGYVRTETQRPRPTISPFGNRNRS